LREADRGSTPAHSAIQGVLSAFADAVNRREWRELAGLFMPEATLEPPTNHIPSDIRAQLDPNELARGSPLTP
jgi:hypothetical protein